MTSIDSVNDARRRQLEIKKRIKEILDADLVDEEESRSILNLFTASASIALKYIRRKIEINKLEKDLINLEAYLMYTKTVAVDKAILLETIA